MSGFKKATRENIRLRLAFVGPAGTGKTFSALRVATALGGGVALVDTEHGSASKYAHRFDFDVCELTSYDPRNYIDQIREAEKAGYDVLIIDSLSHAWMGKDGALEMVDRSAARNKGNSFAGWRDVTPLHNALVDAILASKLHVIVTMRSKVEYVLETNEKGKQVPRKVGMQPIQREGLDFEFDVVGDLDDANTFHVTKTRCETLTGKSFNRPGEDLAELLREWMSSGAEEDTTGLTSATETTAAQPSPTSDPSVPISETWQHNNRHIHGLGTELGYTHEQLSDSAKKRYGVASMNELSTEQQEEIIAALEAKRFPAGVTQEAQ